MIRQYVAEQDLEKILALACIPDTESNRDQLDMMMGALMKHDERNRKYKDQWKGSGWMGAIFDIQKKAQRLFRQWWGETETEGADDDDAIDLINFACFFLRARRDGNRWGTWL